MQRSTSIKRVPGAQWGIASVEAVLLLPIILLFIVVLLHVTKILKTNNEAIVDSRYHAWREVIGLRDNPLLPGKKAINGEIIDTSVRHQGSGDQDGLISAMRSAGDDYYNGKSQQLTQVLQSQDHDMLVASSEVEYFGDSKLKNWKFDIKQHYALVGTSIWTGEDLPIGYDNYLRNTLNSKILFTRLFPCARGASSSAKSSC